MLDRFQNEVSIDEIHAGNFLCPQGEEHLVHVKIELKNFDPKTGKRISNPHVATFSEKQYFKVDGDGRNLVRAGYEIEVLHNPQTWREQQAAAKIAEVTDSKKSKKSTAQ